MNSALRSIAIRRLNTLSAGSMLESGRGISTPTAKAAYLTQLAELGFRVTNPQAFHDGMLARFDEDIKVLEKLRGGDVQYVPLFSGFPNEVPDKDIFLVKRIMGFAANWMGMLDESDGVRLENGMIIPDWLFDLDQFGGDPILGRQDLGLFEKGVADQAERQGDDHVEWIDLYLATEEELEVSLREWMANCFYAKSSIKVALKDDIEILLIHFGIDHVDTAKVTFKETKTYLTNFLWLQDRFEESVQCMDNPTDVLRLMAALTDSDVSLAETIKFPKLSRRQRRAILSVVDRSTNGAEDLNRYRDLWLALGRGLHPGEYQSQYPKAAAAFDTLRNQKIRSFESRVNSALQARNIQGAISLLKTRPAVFGRRLHHLLELATPSLIAQSRGGNTAIANALKNAGVKASVADDTWSDVLDAFEQVAHRIPIKNLITLQAYFRTIEGLDYRTTINKKGKLRVYDNKKNRITSECNDRLNDILVSAVDRAMQDKESWKGKRVHIDPDIRSYVVPLAQRNATDGLMALARGSRVKIDTSKVVRLFIYWKEKERTTDLDLSAICYDKDMKFLGQVSYTNLSSGNIVHSGDITSAPHGAAEFIDIPIAKIKKNMSNVRYISTQTYVYYGENFLDLEECYAGWMIRDKTSRSQKSFDVKTVQTKFDVRGKGRYVIPCLLDLETDEIIYVDLYMSGIGNYNRVEGSIQDVSIVTREVARMYDTRPNMYDLAVANAVGRGAEIVDDPEEADITFGVSGTTFEVTDIELILDELI